MKKLILITLCNLAINPTWAQDKDAATKLVDEGVAYHDKGDFEGAISRYNKALEVDKDNLLALSEKALTLLSMENPEDAILICQKAIALHPGEKELKTVYVTYGNASDSQKKTDKSLEIYDEGIKAFPDYYQLHFNKGVTLASVKKYDEAIVAFQNAVGCNPNHASSHSAIARLSNLKNKKVQSLLAYCRFFALEPTSKRAKENITNLEILLKPTQKDEKDKSISVNIIPETLDETKLNQKPIENNFIRQENVLTLESLLDFDKKNLKRTEVENFLRKLEVFVQSLNENQKDNFGFYWDYYVPYFVEMKNSKQLNTFAYIAFASKDYPYVDKWIKSHKKEIDAFYDWSDAFEWKGTKN
jgi:tetratricopeptide (TPR) repeat protein